MKKVICVMIAGALISSIFATSVFAAVKEDSVEQKDRIVAAFSEAAEKDGSALPLQNEDLQKMRNYLDAYVQDSEITPAQADTVLEGLQKGSDYLASSDAVTVEDLAGGEKRKLLQIANAAAESLNLAVTPNSSRDGIEVFEKSDPSVSIYQTSLKADAAGTTIKQTGDPSNPGFLLWVLSGMVLLTGSLFFTAKKMKLDME